MTENLYETQYEITKKTKLKQFYESNKILIFSLILIFIIFISSFAFYLGNKEKKKILLSENYIQVKIYLLLRSNPVTVVNKKRTPPDRFRRRNDFQHKNRFRLN